MNPYAIIIFFPIAYIWYLIMQSKDGYIKVFATVTLCNLMIGLVAIYCDIWLLPILSAIPLWFFIAKWIAEKMVDIG